MAGGMTVRHLTCLGILLAGTGPVLAAPRLVLDYRNPAMREAAPRHSPAERAEIARALEGAPAPLRTDMGTTFAVLGMARGAFTRPGAQERIYLIQRAAPAAIDPFPNAPAPALLVLAEGTPRFYRLTKPTQFQRLAASADADRDGRDEVLLEGSFMNMGQSVTSLTAVRLDDASGTAPEMQTLAEVVTDTCWGGAPQRARTVAAILVSESGGFAARRYPQPCR